jgi:3-deoxy-D-manno-octulosonic-acid transferase
MLMRLIYCGLFYLAIPLLFLRLYFRGIKVPAFRQRWAERLAYYQDSHTQEVVWFHAVSFGEVESIFPLLKQLLRDYPQFKILITTTTPTASARIQAVMGSLVEHVYLPYDLPDANRRFLTHFKPRLAVIVETEIWLNLFSQCQRRSIPIIIINARLSETSYQGYRKFSGLIQPALQAVTQIAAQTAIDAQRFIELTQVTDKVQVIGNLKFDIDPNSEFRAEGLALRQHLFPQRFIWIIASTHKDEEAIFLPIYQQLKSKIPQLLLLIVPRNMERFEEVKKICENRQLQVVTRTSAQICLTSTDVYLVDTMGELKRFYAAADVAFVGGSMVAVGGHNVLEPAAVEIPVLFGPYMANFKAIADGLLHAQAAIQCETAAQFSTTVLKLYQDIHYRNQLSNNALAFIKQNQGVTDRVIHLLIDYLNDELIKT